MKAVIQFDGGCVPNPGQKYGSYNITLDDTFEIQKHRFPLGYGTNNEAEFESLLTALKELQEASKRSTASPSEIEVHVITDSRILQNWLKTFDYFRPHKCKNGRRLAMGALAGKCVALLKHFKSFTVEWKGRDNNVAVFGH